MGKILTISIQTANAVALVLHSMRPPKLMDWTYRAIYVGNIMTKNRQKQGEKEHPAGLPRDV